MSKDKKSGENNKKINNVYDKLKVAILKFINKYWDLMVMNLIIFVLTVFIESIYIHKLKFLIWAFNTLLFIVVPTAIFTIKRGIKSKSIVLSVPMLYILFLMFLDFCTLRELYGISSLGLDKIPNYIDALMVVFIFTLFEYVTVHTVKLISLRKKKS